jgi:WD40 repeat protein
MREKYVVSYVDHPEAERGVGADVIVESEVETIANMPGKRLKSKGIKRSWQVQPGMVAAQTTIDTQDQGTMRARAILVKNRLFLIIVHSPSMDKYEEITQKIYDSFQIVGHLPDPSKDGPKDEVKDTDKKDDDRKDEIKDEKKDSGKKEDDKKDSDKIAKTDGDKKEKKEGKSKPRTGPFVGHTGFIEGVALSSKGDRLATVSRDGTLRVWEYPSGKETLVAKVQEEYREPNSVAFHPTEDRLVVGLGGPLEKIVYFDLAKGKETSRGPVEGSALYIAFTPDGKDLIFLGRGGVHRLDPNMANKGTQILEAFPVILSGDGKTLFAHRGVEFWLLDMETKMVEKSPEGWPRWERGIRSWAISGDGSLLAYGRNGGSVFFADPVKKTHLPLSRVIKTTMDATALALSFKGELLALRDDRGWQVYSLPDGKLVAEGKEQPRHLLFAPDGTLVMTNRENVVIREGPKFEVRK